MLDVSEKKLLKAAESGQRAGCLGDFDGDGAQDMALALPNGEVYVFFRDNGGGDSYNVSAVLPVKGACKGPVTVVGWVKSSRRGGKPRCLGAWNVAPGTRAAFLGREQPGPVTIEWTPPGGKKQKKRITVEDEPVRLQIK